MLTHDDKEGNDQGTRPLDRINPHLKRDCQFPQIVACGVVRINQDLDSFTLECMAIEKATEIIANLVKGEQKPVSC